MMRNVLKLFLMLGCASLLHSTEVSEHQAQEFMQLLCYSCEGASVFLDNAPPVVSQQVFKDLGSVVESSPVAVLAFLHAALSKLNSGQPLDPFELSRIVSWFGRVHSNIDGKLDGGVQALESSLKFVVAYVGCLMVTHVARKCVGHLLEHGILERDSEELCEKIIGERAFDVERKASKKVGEIVKTYKKITPQVEGFLWRALPDYAQNIRTLGIATVDDRLSGPFLAFFLHYCLLDGKIEEMSPWFIRALSGERAFHSTSTTFYPPSAREYFRRLQDDSGIDQQELGDARLYYANEISELQRALSEGIDRHQRLINKLKARKPSYAEIVGGFSSQIALVKKVCELLSHEEFFMGVAEKREEVRVIIVALGENQNEIKSLFEQLSLPNQQMGSVQLKYDEATRLQRQLFYDWTTLCKRDELSSLEQVVTSEGVEEAFSKRGLRERAANSRGVYTERIQEHCYSHFQRTGLAKKVKRCFVTLAVGGLRRGRVLLLKSEPTEFFLKIPLTRAARIVSLVLQGLLSGEIFYSARFSAFYWEDDKGRLRPSFLESYPFSVAILTVALGSGAAFAVRKRWGFGRKDLSARTEKLELGATKTKVDRLLTADDLTETLSWALGAWIGFFWLNQEIFILLLHWPIG